MLFFDGTAGGATAGYAGVVDAFRAARETIQQLQAERYTAVRESNRERRAAYAAMTAERHAALASAAMSPVSKALAVVCLWRTEHLERSALRRTYEAEKSECRAFARDHPVPTLVSFLRAHNDPRFAGLLEHHANLADRVGVDSALGAYPKLRRSYVNGETTYRWVGRDAGVAFRIAGESVILMRDDDRTIGAALFASRDAFGGAVQLNGTPDFIEGALRLAVAFGIPVVNEDLQTRYAEMAYTRDVRGGTVMLPLGSMQPAGSVVAQAGAARPSAADLVRDRELLEARVALLQHQGITLRHIVASGLGGDVDLITGTLVDVFAAPTSTFAIWQGALAFTSLPVSATEVGQLQTSLGIAVVGRWNPEEHRYAFSGLREMPVTEVAPDVHASSVAEIRSYLEIEGEVLRDSAAQALAANDEATFDRLTSIADLADHALPHADNLLAHGVTTIQVTRDHSIGDVATIAMALQALSEIVMSGQRRGR